MLFVKTYIILVVTLISLEIIDTKDFFVNNEYKGNV